MACSIRLNGHMCVYNSIIGEAEAEESRYADGRAVVSHPCRRADLATDRLVQVACRARCRGWYRAFDEKLVVRATRHLDRHTDVEFAGRPWRLDSTRVGRAQAQMMSRNGDDVVVVSLQLLAETVSRGGLVGSANNAVVSRIVRDGVATGEAKTGSHDDCMLQLEMPRFDLTGTTERVSPLPEVYKLLENLRALMPALDMASTH